MIRIIPHGPIFQPAAELLHYELAKLEYPVELCKEDARSSPECLNIFVGPVFTNALPAHACVWWNFELHPGIGLSPREHLRYMNGREFLWEYCTSNAHNPLPENEAVLQLGYSPAWVRVDRRSTDRPIDILFMGAKSKRRFDCIEACKMWNYKVVWDAFWGDAFWEAMGSAKIVLNLHAYHEFPQFESLRCFPAVQSGACVVGEKSSNPGDYHSSHLRRFFELEIDKIPEACRYLLESGEWNENRFEQWRWLRYGASPFRSALKHVMNKTLFFFTKQGHDALVK